MTNNCAPDDFIKNVRTNGRFLYSAVNAFAPQDAMAFFEGLGVPLKTERGNRVFPVSDKAVDIVDAMTRFAKDEGAKFLLGERAVAVERQDGRVSGVRLESGGASSRRRGRDCNRRTQLPADRVGRKRLPDGKSAWAHDRAAASVAGTGHLPGELLRRIDGLSLKNVTLTLKNQKGKAVYSELGEMLIHPFRRVRSAGAFGFGLYEGCARKLPVRNRPQTGAQRTAAGRAAPAGFCGVSKPRF